MSNISHRNEGIKDINKYYNYSFLCIIIIMKTFYGSKFCAIGIFIHTLEKISNRNSADFNAISAMSLLLRPRK